MIKKTTLLIGLNDKDTLRQELNTDEVISWLQYQFDNCTITECAGSYKHMDGTVTKETSLQVSIYDNNYNYIDDVIVIKYVLNQESIGVVTEYVDIKFI